MPRSSVHLLRRPVLPALALLVFGGCAMGPAYKRPDVPTPEAFKEPQAWKTASPSDDALRGSWWSGFADPELDGLEARVETGSQTLAEAVAAYQEARQLARSDRAGLFPTVSADASATRSKASATVNSPSPIPANNFSGSLQADWAPDFWGKVTRTEEADVATAQESAAELAVARLSLQTQVAEDYIQLRALDTKAGLIADAVVDYAHTLEIARNKYAVGVAARSDVISAQAQLDAARAQELDAGIGRAQLEHAIAVLLGEAPSGLSIKARHDLGLVLPGVPQALPSALLERRPDIAAAERQVAAANARIGIQTAAYFPSLTLSADAGYAGSPLHTVFEAPFRFWALGAQAGDTLLDWGQRRDLVRAARAAHDQSVAAYRQTVLGAFEQVEDDLSGLGILAEEEAVQQVALSESSEAAQIALNEYKAGTVDYTTVAAAQVTELNNRETVLSIQESRLLSAAALYQALGGGWKADADLPEGRAVLSGRN